MRSATQRRILQEVRTYGPRIYDGRSARAIRALAATGLVDVEWGDPPHLNRARRITVTATAETGNSW